MSPPWKNGWLLLALVLTAWPAHAEPPGARPKPVTQPQIELLVRRLGSDSFADREEAMKELRRLGKPALEALRHAAATGSDAEVRRRAAALLDQLLDPPYSKLYKAGVQLLEKKEYLKAKTALSEAAELYRKDPTIARAEPTEGDQPVLAEIYLHLAHACRGAEDYEGASGAYGRASYYYNYNRPQRERIERESRAMIDDLVRHWENGIRAKINKDRGLKALTAKYPLVVLHSRRYACGGYLKSAYSFIDETSDEDRHRNRVHILFDNGWGENTFNINMTTDQRNLVVDLGPADFTKDPDPKKVDPDSDNFWVPDRCKVVEGHVYLERVCDDEGNKFYVVLQVIAADAQSRYLAFVWRRLPGGKLVKHP